MTKTLTTTGQVIEALGGYEAVREMTSAKTNKVVGNWNAEGQFPSRTYVVMIAKLRARGLSAPASLWGMVNTSARSSRVGAAAAALAS